MWTGNISPEGYGRLGWHDYAHRVSYQLFVGEIPAGFHIDHLCRTRRCVRPDHLEAVTQAENNRRQPWGVTKMHALKTHCPAGHPYDEENTRFYTRKNGQTMRTCRACRRAWNREYRRRRADQTG